MNDDVLRWVDRVRAHQASARPSDDITLFVTAAEFAELLDLCAETLGAPPPAGAFIAICGTPIEAIIEPPVKVQREWEQAVVATLRFLAGGWVDGEDDRAWLALTADQIDAEVWADSTCCPLCAEVECDTSCPLAPLRKRE